MDEQEMTERLVRIEERAKSNTHRIDRLEPLVKEIHTMNKTMVQLVGEVQHTNENLAELKDKVDVLEAKPSIRIEQIKSAIIAAIASALIGGFFAAYFF